MRNAELSILRSVIFNEGKGRICLLVYLIVMVMTLSIVSVLLIRQLGLKGGATPHYLKGLTSLTAYLKKGRKKSGFKRK